ncbi:MAG TPA: aspartate kinase [Roseiflexaceae bacterium]
MDVMKFGVVSVSEAARLRDLARIVKAAHDDGRALVVVCTALGGITDKLIGAARGAAVGNEAAVEEARRELWSRHRVLAEKLAADEWEREALYREWADLLKTFDRFTRSIATLREHSPRSIDAVAALGERFATHLVATALRQAGVSARTVDAAELIVTDNHYGSAWPFPEESSERIRARLGPLLQARIVPVITGYIGATREGVVTTLGRGGGDYSATLIGAALGADQVCIWTDVDGILTADPKIVPEARTLAELSYVEAAEIATFGAEVLHPRTLAPVAEQGIPLRIGNVLRPERPGTRVMSQPQPTAHAARSIISARGLSLLGIGAAAGSAAGWTPDLAARALARLSEAGVEILNFAQSFSERSLTLTVRGADATFARDSLTAAFARERAAGALREIMLTTPVALVAVISAPGGDGLAPRTLAALGRAGAHVLALAQGTASYHISFILPEAEVDRVVKVLHDDLGLAAG